MLSLLASLVLIGCATENIVIRDCEFYIPLEPSRHDTIETQEHLELMNARYDAVCNDLVGRV